VRELSSLTELLNTLEPSQIPDEVNQYLFDRGRWLHPVAVSDILVNIGIMRDVVYESTTGSGKEKHFREITHEYLEFGENIKTRHKFKTEARFYVDRFPELIAMAFDNWPK